MADLFGNYADLAAARVEGSDYTRTAIIPAGATVAVISIHGGGIEPGSSEAARAVAGDTRSYYDFAGIKLSGNVDLHITSSNFDEPLCESVVRPSTRTLSFHGFTGTTGVAETAIGGLDEELRDRVADALTKAGFLVTVAGFEIAGTDPENVCNRNAHGAGVQFEMSRALRDSFFPGGNTKAIRDSGARTPTFTAYTGAIVSALADLGTTAPSSVTVPQAPSFPVSRWRYIAQRALTGEWLDWDLPLTVGELSWALSGAGSLRATVAPDVGGLRAADGSPLLEEWGTLIYAECDGEIRWGGVVTRSEFAGSSWDIEAAGFTTYPHGVPYLGEYIRQSVDPLDAYREIWAHIQSNPDGNLGVTVDSTTSPVRLGTVAEPYSLTWWEAPDCGGELDSLAKETPFDYVEEHAWYGDTITHRVRLGYPRLGRRRDDLAFIQGDNVLSVVEVDRDGDGFANEVIGLGAGEGRKSIQRRIPQRDGRLRRPHVYSDKSVSTTARMDALCRSELATRRNVVEVASVDVLNHPHAPIGSWSLGDDVLIRADIPWLGEVAIWSRVVGWSLVGDDRARLSLRRSDAFTYRRTE